MQKVIIDDKGRLYGKVSIIDILAILILVAIVGVLGYRYALPAASGSLAPKHDTLNIVFYEEEVNDFTTSAIKKGSPVRERLQNTNFGKVVDIEIGESVSWGESAEGQFVSSGKSGFSSVRVTMEVKGTLERSGIIIDNSQYYLGQYVTLYIGNCALYGTIHQAEKKDSN